MLAHSSVIAWKLASAESDANDSDNWGFGFFSDIVSFVVWTFVAVAILLALAGLLYVIGRRIAAKREDE